MRNQYSAILRVKQQLENMAELQLLRATSRLNAKQDLLEKIIARRIAIQDELAKNPAQIPERFETLQALFRKIEIRIGQMNEEIEQLRIEMADCLRQKQSCTQRREGIQDLNDTHLEFMVSKRLHEQQIESLEQILHQSNQREAGK